MYQSELTPSQKSNIPNMQQSQPVHATIKQQRSHGAAAVILIGTIMLLLGLSFGFVAGASIKKTQYSKKLADMQEAYHKLKADSGVESVNSSKNVAYFSYLNIPEWKIRLPLNNKYTDVVYRVKHELGADYIEITSATLAKISTCMNYNGQIGTITRAAAGTVPQPNKQVVGFDGQIYMYQAFDKTCTSNPKEVEAPYKSSILEQFTKLEPIPTRYITAD